MHVRCEVCASFRPEGARAGREVVEVSFDVRTVVLCRGHARIAENSGVTTFEELRQLYGSGRRSFVPRRAPYGNSAGQDQRSGYGRRVTDRVA